METQQVQTRRLPLIQHSLESQAELGVEVVIKLNKKPEASLVSLEFEIKGRQLPEVVFPEAKPQSQRSDNLWQTTCLELFVPNPGHSYFEWNFSPSGDWQCYEFESYREKRGEGLPEVGAVPFIAGKNQQLPSGKVRSRLFLVDLQVSKEIKIEDLKPTSVIEFKSGEKTYWAEKHFDDEKPDFHLFV